MALSTRGQGFARPDPAFRLWEILPDLYDPSTNPNGYVSLGVAENTLMHDTLNSHISKNLCMPSQDFTYGDGKKTIRAILSRFFNKYFEPAAPVVPAHITVTNGCTSAIEHLCWALGNPGDGFLLGRPYYGGFVPDITSRFGTELVAVDFGNVDPLSNEAVRSYEQKILSARDRGQTIRGLFLCQPHNPLGRCYSRETVIDLMRLCQKYKIHFISDEIYALSVFTNTIDDTATVPFTSAMSVETGTDGPIDPALVHVIWGVSKDFGANGLRFGTIVSQRNPDLHAALTPVSLFSSTSAITDHAVSNFLGDQKWVEDYISTNTRLLAQHHEHVVRWARRNKIEYAPGVNAAFFLWVNLGKAYRDKHGEVDDVSNVVMDALLRHKVFLASGAQFGAEQPGWFRIVFSQPATVLDMGLQRVLVALADTA